VATKFVGFIHRTDEFRRHSANGASVRQEVRLIRWSRRLVAQPGGLTLDVAAHLSILIRSEM